MLARLFFRHVLPRIEPVERWRAAPAYLSHVEIHRLEGMFGVLQGTMGGGGNKPKIYIE